MASVVIVVVQPLVEGGDSLGFGGVGLGIGPFLEHDAVEPFDFEFLRKVKLPEGS